MTVGLPRVAHSWGMLVAIAIAGCGAPPPPPKAPAPATKKNPPLEADVGGHHLVVRFADSRLSDPHFPPRIQLVELDGNTVFPRDCAAKSKTKPLACSHAHRAVKDGDELHAVAQHVTETQVQIVVAGRSGTNVQCGANDYWVLRVDKSGVSATEPVVGCFTIPSLDQDALNPIVEWGPPLTLKTFDETSSACSLVLPPGAGTWKMTKAKKP